MNSWQPLILQSKVNKSRYSGENLAIQNWAWPRDTWFQQRLDELRKRRRHIVMEPGQSQVKRSTRPNLFELSKS